MTKSETSEHWAGKLMEGGFAFCCVPSLPTAFVGASWVVCGSIAGQTTGALAGVSETTIARTDSAVGKSMRELNFPESLRAGVANSFKQQGGWVVLVEKPFPPGDRTELTQMSCLMASTLAWLPKGVSRTDCLASQGADTVLELQLIHPGLRGEGTVNPSLAFCVQVEAQLTDVASGRKLAGCTLHYRGEAHKFSRWGANDAKLLREELTRFCSLAGDAIGRELLSGNNAAPGMIASNIGN